jgi:hypothetical protein
MKCERGADGTIIGRRHSWPTISWCACGEKNPALTLPQAKLLLSAVLPETNLTVERAIEIITYRQDRNYSADHSHRHRTDARHRRRRKPPKLKEPSL